MKSFLDELSEYGVSLSEGERKLFSAPLRWVLLANGDADFHDNVIFFGFDQRESDPVLVAKVPRLVQNGWMIKTEYDHLLELWDCMGSSAANYLPKPYALPTLQERSVLLLSYVPGESMTRLSRKSFWGDSRQVSSLSREAARTLRELHSLTERPVRQEDRSNLNLQTKADTFRKLFPLTAEEDQTLSDLVRTIDETSKTASRAVIIQGDFWHGNMIYDRANRRLRFVDWQFARWSTDVSLDVYFFLLAGTLSATEGDIQERAAQAFHLLNNWRRDVIPEYVAAYGQPGQFVLLPQKYGMMLCCVEKAVRSALEFGYRHPDDLLWRYLFAELQNWPLEP
ncbi:MAG TPA: aminoglycoside phosphotransferase family protein [Anaerolineales bacterium]|jgi:aminoglycoside phosphotransferase (APT) family kinase protein|nr:aminoglycoside phosphotransferase family protein [Anaerolineales bacterium]